MKAVAETLGVARSHRQDKVRLPPKPRGSYRKTDDDTLIMLVRRLVDERPTYGYRRVTALANRERSKAGEPTVNPKRVYRIMGSNSMLLARHTGRRTRRIHDGKVIVMRSNLRWCSGASRSAAGTASLSGSRSSSMPMTARSSPGMPSSHQLSAAAWFG